MTVKVTGLRNFRLSMRKLGASLNEAVDDGVFLTAQEVRTYAIESIKEVSPGKTVRRARQGGGTYSHVAAGPGQAPNSDTGFLVASIVAERAGDMEYDAGSRLPYAAYLEFGTTKMIAKPFLEPALTAKGFNMISNIEAAVGLAIRGMIE